jgi:predicted nucleic acid-binding protein
MFLIDTNIFLELFLGQEKAEECEKLLEKISRGELEAIISKFTVHAIEATLNNPTLILAFLRNVQNSLGLSVYETSVEEEMAASMLMDKVKLDFDDAIQYYIAKKLGVEAIISYDKHFDTVDIKRKEPSAFAGATA